MFSVLSKTEITIKAPLKLLSAHALNLVLSKILLFGKELMIDRECIGKEAASEKGHKFTNCLTHYQTTKFSLVQTETNCRQHFTVHLKWKINAI